MFSKPAERSGVERHLAACPACRRQADKEQGARRLLRRSSRAVAERAAASRASDSMRGAGPRAFGRALARFGPWWRVRLVPVLLTVVVMIFGASAFFSIATRHSDALLAAQLTADHSKCFKLFGPPDGTAADAPNIERMLFEQVRLEDSRPIVVGRRRCAADWRAPLPVRRRTRAARDVSRARSGCLVVRARRQRREKRTISSRSAIDRRSGRGMGQRSCSCRPRMLEASRARPDM